MDLHEKIRTLPPRPGVYLYKNADGEVIYVGKAKNLRSRVRSYLLEASQANAKTGSLMRDAVDVDYILVDNEHEALALENNLIKQRKPRFNILLRDDKTYPYVKLTLGDRWPKVFVTRRLRRDGSVYYGPYFPGNLAYRVVDLIHRSFLLPSCKVDLSRYHARPCLQYYIGRCLGPCVENLTTPEAYSEAVRDAQLFLEGRTADLNKSLQQRMAAAAANEQYELAAKYRDLLVTIDQLSEKQRIASVEDDDADVFGYHCENGMIAVNLFHLRGGKIVDRREFFWEDLAEVITDPDESFDDSSEEHALHGVASTSKVLYQGTTSVVPKRPQNEGGALAPASAGFEAGAFFSALLKQLYIDQPWVPRTIYVPVDFADRATLASLLADHTKHRVEIAVPQRGEKRSLVDLAAQNAKQSYDQRFRVLAPSRKAIQEALQDALMLEDLPRTIECFDISHIQGAETVASMVVWEDGEMKKSAYRKFKIKTVEGVDDFASMREVITRRYRALVRDSDADAPDPSDQRTTQRVPHIWPVLPDVGMKNPDQEPLDQGTTQRVPHIWPVLPDLGMKSPDQEPVDQGTTSSDQGANEPLDHGTTSHLPEKPKLAGPGLDFETRDSREARRLPPTSHEPYQGTTSQLAEKPNLAGPGLDFETRDSREARHLPPTSHEPYQGTTSHLPEKPNLAGPGLDFETRDSREARRLLPTSHEPCQGTTSVVPNEPKKKGALAPEESSAEEPVSEEAVLKGHGFSRAINLANKKEALAPEERGSNRRPLPSLILIDGGIGQLHAAAAALESLGITTQPLASIAKREEVIYLYGQEDEPVVLDRRSPVLHLIQRIRDESHRFAITYHRKRREMRDRDSELLAIPGVGARTRQRLLEHFGSLRSIAAANLDSLAAVHASEAPPSPPKPPSKSTSHFHMQARSAAGWPIPSRS
jgi:excinuclease ABC subunit C